MSHTINSTRAEIEAHYRSFGWNALYDHDGKFIGACSDTALAILQKQAEGRAPFKVVKEGDTLSFMGIPIRTEP